MYYYSSLLLSSFCQIPTLIDVSFGLGRYWAGKEGLTCFVCMVNRLHESVRRIYVTFRYFTLHYLQGFVLVTVVGLDWI